MRNQNFSGGILLSLFIFLSLLFSFLISSPAFASHPRVRPILQCVVDSRDGTLTAVFGYNNPNTVSVTIPVGSHNRLRPGREDRGQPTIFIPGRTPRDQGAFAVVFRRGRKLAWDLGRETAEASSHSRRCASPPGTPQARDDEVTTPRATPVTIDVLANDTDPQGDPLKVIRVTQPLQGEAVLNQDGTVTYTPKRRFIGRDRFTYTVSDGNFGTDQALVSVTVSRSVPPPQLHEARSAHTAILLSSGKALLAGGHGSGGALGSAEVFDPETRRVTALSAELSVARSNQAASLLPQGEVLLVSGSSNGAALHNGELFNPVQELFELLPAEVNQAREGHTTTLLLDGRVLILGGTDGNSTALAQSELFDATADPFSGAIYDPRSGVFTPLPHALNIPRWNHTATLLPSGHILIAGGENTSGALDSAELFDPTTGQSTLLTSKLNSPRSGHTATLRPDGTALVAGGRRGDEFLASLELFRPTGQSFSELSELLSTARAEHSATLLPSGEIWIAGGEEDSGVLRGTEILPASEGDTAPPRLMSSLPLDGADAVVLNSILSVRFSEPVNPATVSPRTVRLVGPDGDVLGSVSIGEEGLYVFLVPFSPLSPATLYTLTLSGVRDLAGNALPPTSIAFTTAGEPVITGFTPIHGPIGTVVRITGDNFSTIRELNRVAIGMVTAPVTAAARTELTIAVPDDVAVGPARIAVETPGGRAESADLFTVENPLPIVASVEPAEVPAGTAGVQLTLIGQHFVANSTVNFDGAPLVTTFMGSNQLRADVPPQLLTTPGVFPVTVTNPPPGGGTSNALSFRVIAARASLGDFVWNDLDFDGIQDSGEPGIAGVVVRLLERNGSQIATTTTGPNGLYLFTNLLPDEYAVQFVAPPGFALSPPDQAEDDTRDSDPDPVSGRTGKLLLGSGENRLDVDAGLFMPPTLIESSPAHGEVDVAVTRETILRFSNPLSDSANLNDNILFAEFGGRRLSTRIHRAPDRRSVTLFYNQDLPASARIRVTLVGDDLLDVFGNAVDADRDGSPGGVARIDFDTLTLTTLPDTRVCGRVFASELAQGDPDASVNVPLEGATITVDGLETILRAVTDDMGNFCLDPSPVGRFFVHIDGRTAVNQVPPGDYYPFVGKQWESVAGQTVNIGDVFLPRIVAGTLQPVSRTAATRIQFPASVISEFPEFEGVEIVVPADSLYSDDGSRGGMVGLAPVPPDRLPGPPPAGLEFPVVITVQTDGASNFDMPVPACFPNLPDPSLKEPLAPGTKSALYSFNHDTGRWEHVGPMTVTDDGRLICTDPGVGILAPGWHGAGPPPTQPPPPAPPRPPCQCQASNASASTGGPKAQAQPCENLGLEEALNECLEDAKEDTVICVAGALLAAGACFVGGPASPLCIALVLAGEALCLAVAIFDLHKCEERAIKRNPPPPCSASDEAAAATPRNGGNGALPLLADSRASPPSEEPLLTSGVQSLAVTTTHLKAGALTPTAQTPNEAEGGESRFLEPWGPEPLYSDNLAEGASLPILAGPLRLLPANLLVRLLTSMGLTLQSPTDLPLPDPVIEVLLQLGQQIRTLLYPFAVTGQPVPPNVQAEVEKLIAAANVAAGGDAARYLRDYFVRVEESLAPLETTVGESEGNAPPYPVSFAAAMSRPSGALVYRDETRPLGQYTVFVPRDGTLEFVGFYDRRTKSYAMVFPRVRPGAPYKMRRFTLVPVDDTFLDFDKDGLADVVEFVLGTNPGNPDSDGDGITDGAEVDQGTNPLDGRPVRTGIIATADTPGTAVDVCAVNDIATVADSEAGVSVLNVFNGMNPTVVAQVDTPGTAQAVACAGNLIAVADGAQGVVVVDITDPPSARIIHQVNLGGAAQAVTASAGIGYVGLNSGRLVVVDLASGTILQEVSGLGNVHDLSIEGDTLFVSLDREMHAYRLSLGPLEFLGKVGTSLSPEGITRRRRLFVGGGFAYVTSYPGYDVIDVKNPEAMRLIGRATDSIPNSFKSIVANGSGLGVAAVGVNPRDDGTHDVWLFDVSDPSVTTRFLTVLPTPGLTRAASIYNGLAYTADGGAGLQVINYLPYDAKGVPPTIRLETNFAAGVAEEGQTMRVSAIVGDDVQVRNVEFYVDGVKVLTDGNFPFEHRFVTPLIAEQPSFTLRGCATDTGRNRTCTEESRITLTEDATPPRVTGVSPAAGSAAIDGSVAAVSATFSEPINVATLGAPAFQLYSGGPDGVAGTNDDVLVGGGVVSYREEIRTAFLTFAAPLPIDLYRAFLSRALSDQKGNPLGADFAWTFRIKGPSSWINPAGGLWTDPANWSDGAVPGPQDVALITLSGTYTVTLNQSTTVGQIALGGSNGDQTLWIRGNPFANVMLTVTSHLLNAGTLRLESEGAGTQSALTVTNGVLTNTGVINVNVGSGGPRSISASFVNQGTLNVNQSMTFLGALTTVGTIRIGEGKKLSLNGNAQVFNFIGGSITGSGLLELTNATLNFNGGTTAGRSPELFNSTLNFGAPAGVATFIQTGGSSQASGRIAAGQALWIRGNPSFNTTVTVATGFTNAGTIRLESEGAGTQSAISGTWTNAPTGIVEVNVGSGGSRNLLGDFTNQGTVKVNHNLSVSGTLTNRGTVEIAGGQKLSLSGSGQVFNHNGGTVAANGLLELSNSTFNFNGGTTSGNPVELFNSILNIGAPAIGQSSFTMTGGSSRVTGNVAAGQTLWVRGNPSFNTTVTVATGFTNAGMIRLESEGAGTQSAISGTWTNAPNGVVEVNVGSGGSRNLSGDLTNQGTIKVNHNLSSGTLTNSGTIGIAAGQKLALSGSGQLFNHNGGTVVASGLLEISSSTFNFNGGTTSGNPVELFNSILNIGASATAQASFTMTGGSSQVSGNIAAGQTLWVRGNPSFNTTVTVATGLTNAGTIRLESVGAGTQSAISGTWTNAPTGVVEVNVGSGGSRNLFGALTNQGTIKVNHNLSSGTLTNSGTIGIAGGQKLSLGSGQVFNHNAGTVAAGGLLELSSSPFNFNGGTTSGNPVELFNSILNIGASATGQASFTMTGGSSQVSGNIAAGQTLWVRGNPSFNTTVTAATGFTNAGTIRLESVGAGTQSALRISEGVLTNIGVIDVNQGSGGSRDLFGNLVNAGTINANSSSLSVTGTRFDNVVGGILQGNGSLNVAATTFTNSGVLSPGTSPGTLSIVGAVKQSPTGALNIEIGGLSAGSQFDRLNVSNGVSLDGSLNITLIDSFEPNFGDIFDVLTYASRSGVFSVINGLSIGNGKRFQANYGANRLTLVVVPE